MVFHHYTACFFDDVPLSKALYLQPKESTIRKYSVYFVQLMPVQITLIHTYISLYIGKAL